MQWWLYGRWIKFIIKNNGITSESNYPYNGTCIAKKEASHVAKITGYEEVPSKSETSLMKAVAKQPVSASVDAGGLYFQFYFTGVFTGVCGDDINHGVNIVGYDKTSDGIKYYR